MQGFLTGNKLAAGSAGWRWLPEPDLKESLDCSCSPPTPGRKVKDDYISAPLALFSVAGAKSDKLSLGAPQKLVYLQRPGSKANVSSPKHSPDLKNPPQNPKAPEDLLLKFLGTAEFLSWECGWVLWLNNPADIGVIWL